MFIIFDAKPVAGLDPECVWEESLDQTALNALYRLPKMSYEIGGAIFEKDGKYCYSVAVSNRSRTSVTFKTDKPEGSKLVALYHTHPTLPRRENNPHVFSPPDVKMAVTYDVVSYIRILANNVVKKYIPSKTQVRAVAENAEISDGEIVMGSK